MASSQPSYTLLQFGDDPFKHMYQDPQGLEAFTIKQAAREDPNTIIRLSREEPWSKEHSTIMGPENSYFYFGAEDRPGYIIYGNNQVRIPMTWFLRPGRKETSTSRYFRCQSGKDFKWKVISAYRMECYDGRNVIAVWEITPAREEAFARLSLRPPCLPVVTEILTSLTLNRMAQSLGW